MITDRLYSLAEEEGIEVYCGVNLPITKSVSIHEGEQYYIGIDDSVMQSAADERVHLAHEIGHCQTGAFYSVYAAIDNRRWCENKANAWAIKKLIPKSKLKRILTARNGDISIWELAEHFTVTEDFMRIAIDYYRQFEIFDN